MKPSYGPINQNAFIVTNIDTGIDYWTRTMQVGPFFRFPNIVFESADYRGQTFEPAFDAAIAYSGDLMIELIRPRGPSIFQEFLDAGRTGVQHFAAFADDLSLAAEAIARRGGKRVQGGKFTDGSCLAYFDMGGPEPSILEIAQLSPAILGLFGAIKAAAAAWDGGTPTVTF
jgi:hypothetical protein